MQPFCWSHGVSARDPRFSRADASAEWSCITRSFWLGVVRGSAVALLVGASYIAPTFDAAGRYAPIAWARAALHGGGMGRALLVVVAVVIAIASVGWIFAVFPPRSRRGMRRSLDRLIRHTGRKERTVFGVFAVISGGIGEELLYRLGGPAVLFALTGHLLLSLVVSVALFGLAHYRQQRWKGVFRTAVIGGYLMVLYLVTGQILYCILVHVAINVVATLVYPELVVAARKSFARRVVLEYRNSTVVEVEGSL